jgi:hypothetical protein
MVPLMTSRLSLPLALFLILTSWSLAYFIYYGQWFPPRMAVHFNLVGQPDVWMDRLKFIVIASSTSFMVPPFVVALVGVMPRVLPIGMVSLPDREYWLAPERREVTLGRLMYFALWLGCLVQAFLIAINVTIARANPQVGSPSPFLRNALPVAAAFGGALLIWVVMLSRSFSKPR